MRSKRNRHKCDRRDYDRTRKVLWLCISTHNGLKVQEAKALRYELRGRNEWLKFCYDPLVYISQEDIDRHFENTRIWEKDDYPFNCIRCGWMIHLHVHTVVMEQYATMRG